ncbi:type II toxin-antitoxin system VapC family toxin [Gloeocapsa sp. PCC 73106]|uniref:type II toxin-antitoxin system VapC family toxin n=1 Tax=Gloeocapsa sp. PCC 73106 TaxID=102232 RepID=UPI00350FFFB7
MENYAKTLENAGFLELSITNIHALRAGLLKTAHRDRFDRIIMAQAELENIPFITHNKAFNNGLIKVIPQ